jgi:hypothetical protein
MVLQMSMGDSWIEVVPAAPKVDAFAAFERWLQRHGLSRDALADDEIRVDFIRTTDGDGSATGARAKAAGAGLEAQA